MNSSKSVSNLKSRYFYLAATNIKVNNHHVLQEFNDAQNHCLKIEAQHVIDLKRLVAYKDSITKGMNALEIGLVLLIVERDHTTSDDTLGAIFSHVPLLVAREDA